eukprot:2081773-Lingulodinium_polyedra.AAC.1
MLKTAMREVGEKAGRERAARQAGRTEAASDNDRLDWTMRAARAMCRRAEGALKRCVDAYPCLEELARQGVQAVRDHAV